MSTGSPQLSPGRIRFGVFEADLRTGELRKGGVKVRIEDLSLRALTVLLNRQGEIISRGELWRALWPETCLWILARASAARFEACATRSGIPPTTLSSLRRSSVVATARLRPCFFGLLQGRTWRERKMKRGRKRFCLKHRCRRVSPGVPWFLPSLFWLCYSRFGSSAPAIEAPRPARNPGQQLRRVPFATPPIATPKTITSKAASTRESAGPKV